MEATNQESYERDYTEFLEDLEEDKLFRQNVNIYFSKLREREQERERESKSEVKMTTILLLFTRSKDRGSAHPRS